MAGHVGQLRTTRASIPANLSSGRMNPSTTCVTHPRRTTLIMAAQSHHCADAWSERRIEQGRVKGRKRGNPHHTELLPVKLPSKAVHDVHFDSVPRAVGERGPPPDVHHLATDRVSEGNAFAAPRERIDGWVGCWVGHARHLVHAGLALQRCPAVVDPLGKSCARTPSSRVSTREVHRPRNAPSSQEMRHRHAQGSGPAGMRSGGEVKGRKGPSRTLQLVCERLRRQIRSREPKLAAPAAKAGADGAAEADGAAFERVQRRHLRRGCSSRDLVRAPPEGRGEGERDIGRTCLEDCEVLFPVFEADQAHWKAVDERLHLTARHNKPPCGAEASA